jgi:hypothetical protein
MTTRLRLRQRERCEVHTLGKATGEFQSMFGSPEHQPMFVLPQGASVNVTFHQTNTPNVVNITPTDKHQLPELSEPTRPEDQRQQ